VSRATAEAAPAVPIAPPARRLRVAVLLAPAPGERFEPVPTADPADRTALPTPPACLPPPAAHDDFACVASALRSALAGGEDASLFLMDRGVLYAGDPRLLPLIAAGVDVALCATDAEAQGLDLDAAAARGILIGSQHDHARLVRDSDRFLSFT